MIYFYLNYSATATKRIKENPNYFNDVTNKLTLYISYNRRKQPFRVSTGVDVNPKFWDKKKQIIRSGESNHYEKNKTLELLKTQLYTIINEAIQERIEINNNYLKDKFFPCIKSDMQIIQNANHFIDNWNIFLNNSINKNESTLKNYKHTLSHILKFSKEKNVQLALYKINKDFYDMLLLYFFKDLKITRNTAGKHIKNLRAYMKYCYDKGITKNNDFKEFKIMRDKQIVNYLKSEELKILYDMKFTKKSFEVVRDVFVFACLTGLRYSDLMKIKPTSIRGDYIELIITKTKQPLKTPLHKQAKQILDKYNGTFPRKTNQFYSKYIKQIGKLAGLERPITKIKYIGNEVKEETKYLYEFMSMHMAKRTSVKNLIDSGASIEVIGKITGNKDRKSLQSYYEIENVNMSNAVNKSIDNLNLKG